MSSVAAMEAPLTICENFITWAAVLSFLAARRGFTKRTALVLVVCFLCLGAEMLLMVDRTPFESSLLIRPFFFHMLPLACLIFVCITLMSIAYLTEIHSDMLPKKRGPEVKSGKSLC